MGVALILSPHLDDAVLSCPGRIQRLVRQRVRVIVATVFTESGSGGEQLYRTRKSEDRRAARLLGASVLHLGFRDAPFRSRRYRDFPGIVFGEASEYPATLRAFVKRLRGLVSRVAPSVVLAPLAVGNHVDHRLVRDAALLGVESIKLRLYEDRPYAFLPEQVGHVMGKRISEQPERFWRRYFKTTYVRRYLGDTDPARVIEGWTHVAPFPGRSEAGRSPAAGAPAGRYELRKVSRLKLNANELVRAVAAIECYETQLEDLFAGSAEIRALYRFHEETLYSVALRSPGGPVERGATRTRRALL